ncbi:MAG: BtaA family protein [Acidobacteriota bacterium]
MTSTHTLGDRIDQRIFDAIYSRALVYNTCWEDPAVDRRALNIQSSDTLLVITSAGCNVLDYALCGPERIFAVDANPRQTALLELKIAGIHALAFDDYFALFGAGRHPRIGELYHDALRARLSPFARHFWDRRLSWFTDRSDGDSFYFHGLSGMVARGVRAFLCLQPSLRESVARILVAPSVAVQREIYDGEIAPRLWGPGVNWLLRRQLTMSLLGVPHPQRKEVQRQHAAGVPGFIRESIEYVFRELPVSSNYFWTLYLRGSYSRDCCPEYLRPANFDALKAGLVNCIEPRTCTVTDLLRQLRRHEQRVSKYVLLDHMDWMASYHPRALVEEWRAILDRATPRARVIFRSAHSDPAYLDAVRVGHRGALRRIRDAVHFRPTLAQELTRDDRVHTYAGFHIGDLEIA